MKRTLPVAFVGLSSLLFALPPTLAQTYHAGAGLTLTGTTFSVANGGVTGAMIGLPLSLTASSSSPILTVTNTGSGYGIKTVSTSGTGTYGTNTKYGNVGTLGDINGFGVYGSTAAGPYPYGVFGINRTSGNGDYGILGGVDPFSGIKYPVGVYGSDTSTFGLAVYGNSTHGIGVLGNSLGSSQTGVLGLSSSSVLNGGGSGNGVAGGSGTGNGVAGGSGTGDGVYGSAASGNGGDFSSGMGISVKGSSGNGDGGYFLSSGSNGAEAISDGAGYGLYASTASGIAVYGKNVTTGDYGLFGGNDPVYNLPVGVVGNDIVGGDGVVGNSTSNGGYGVDGECSGTSGIAIYGRFNSVNGSTGLAGNFIGDVTVAGTLTAGAKNFKIDHPLDPEHKYLTHASIESDEMTDIYSGNITTDANGNATVTMPSWFQALNQDFRYQLTSIGGFAPLYIAQKVQNNQFQIAGGKPGMEVSWQVTGVRHDAFALAHPMQVEQDKPASEQGLYQNPEAFGQPESMGLGERHRQEKR